jgi:hypothetical protein
VTEHAFWHSRFSRFIASSELSRLIADPREVVPVSTTMTLLLRAVREPRRRPAGSSTGRWCAIVVLDDGSRFTTPVQDLVPRNGPRSPSPSPSPRPPPPTRSPT